MVTMLKALVIKPKPQKYDPAVSILEGGLLEILHGNFVYYDKVKQTPKGMIKLKQKITADVLVLTPNADFILKQMKKEWERTGETSSPTPAPTTTSATVTTIESILTTSITIAGTVTTSSSTIAVIPTAITATTSAAKTTTTSLKEYKTGDYILLSTDASSFCSDSS